MALKSFEEMAARIGAGGKPTVVVAAAHDAHTLEAVFRAAGEGRIAYRLVGNAAEIRSIAKAHGQALDSADLTDAPDAAAAAERAVALVRETPGAFLMKGRMETATLLRAVLDEENGIRGEGVMSHVAVLEVPAYHKLLAITDGGMLPHPTLEQKVCIVKNALRLFSALGYTEPAVAALAASESVSARMPETGEARRLQEMAQRGTLGRCALDGPISLDLALSRESAEIKGYGSPVAGQADILVTPDIASGNMLCKSMLYTGGAKMAGCVMGASAPIILTSRGASSEEKYLSILLSAASV